MKRIAEDSMTLSSCLCFTLCFVMSAINAFADDQDSFPAKSLIAHQCISCHSGDDAKGKLDLSSREKMIAG
ncbi:MAG: c-type cytochrome domain-containing protein, partial [Schlesneria sp.]